MHWASTSVRGEDANEALAAALATAAAELPGGAADLVFVFLAAAHPASADALARVRDVFGDALVVGCGARGVVGGGREYERVPAVSVLAGRLAGTGVHAFSLDAADLPDEDAPPAAWHRLAGVSPADGPSFLLFTDPFTLPTERLLGGLDFAYPRSVTIGGLASAAGQEGEQVLYAGDRVCRSGGVGLALMGDVSLEPAVAQGCRAIGPPLRITSCDHHLLKALEGRPALQVIEGVLSGASERDRELAEQALLIGFETDPLAGDDAGPWIVRNLLGLDPRTRALVVGEQLRQGRRIRVHVRDAETSHEDLERTLDATGGVDQAPPSAALLFSCLGRGKNLYGRPDHDSDLFRARFGDVPLGGCFCAGEIGPVGATTHLHGYTSVFGLIRPGPVKGTA